MITMFDYEQATIDRIFDEVRESEFDPCKGCAGEDCVCCEFYSGNGRQAF